MQTRACLPECLSLMEPYINIAVDIIQRMCLFSSNTLARKQVLDAIQWHMLQISWDMRLAQR